MLARLRFRVAAFVNIDILDPRVAPKSCLMPMVSPFHFRYDRGLRSVTLEVLRSLTSSSALGMGSFLSSFTTPDPESSYLSRRRGGLLPLEPIEPAPDPLHERAE